MTFQEMLRQALTGNTMELMTAIRERYAKKHGNRVCILVLSWQKKIFIMKPLTCKSLKGRGMGPVLVLVSPCFRENVVVTCKIGSFFV